MQTTHIRQKLHQYIDNCGEKELRLLLAIATVYNEGDDFEDEFSAEDIKEFDERRAKRLNGESRMYSWEGAKKNIITTKST